MYIFEAVAMFFIAWLAWYLAKNPESHMDDWMAGIGSVGSLIGLTVALWYWYIYGLTDFSGVEAEEKSRVMYYSALYLLGGGLVGGIFGTAVGLKKHGDIPPWVRKTLLTVGLVLGAIQGLRALWDALAWYQIISLGIFLGLLGLFVGGVALVASKTGHFWDGIKNFGDLLKKDKEDPKELRAKANDMVRKADDAEAEAEATEDEVRRLRRRAGELRDDTEHNRVSFDQISRAEDDAHSASTEDKRRRASARLADLQERKDKYRDDLTRLRATQEELDRAEARAPRLRAEASKLRRTADRAVEAADKAEKDKKEKK